MSIPDRFLRVARHKLGELKDWFDQVDEEREARAEQEAERQRTRLDARAEARRELDEPASLSTANSSAPTNAPPRATRETGTAAHATVSAASQTPMASQPDPLAYHYRLLGLEPGVDFAAVQARYNQQAARCDPSRFVAGSSEADEARRIRERLDASYRVLRDALDTTARRFDLLEFDMPSPQATQDPAARPRKDEVLRQKVEDPEPPVREG